MLWSLCTSLRRSTVAPTEPASEDTSSAPAPVEVIKAVAPDKPVVAVTSEPENPRPQIVRVTTDTGEPVHAITRASTEQPAKVVIEEVQPKPTEPASAQSSHPSTPPVESKPEPEIFVVKQPTVVVELEAVLVKQPTVVGEPEAVLVKLPTVVGEPEAVLVKHPTVTDNIEPEMVVVKQATVPPAPPKVIVTAIDQAQSAFDDPTYGTPIKEWPTNNSPAEVVVETTPLITKPDVSVKVETLSRTRRMRICLSKCCGSRAIKKELDKVKNVEKLVEPKAKQNLNKDNKKVAKEAVKGKNKATKVTKG